MIFGAKKNIEWTGMGRRTKRHFFVNMNYEE